MIKWVKEPGENEEKGEDDKDGEYEVDECAWVPEELKWVLGYQGYQGTLFRIRLPELTEKIKSAFNMSGF